MILGERASDGTFDHVGIDDVAASREAVAHLIALGRRRIAAIGDQPYATGEAAQRRTQGFREAHAQAGLAPDESLIIRTARFNRLDGAQAMSALLDRHDRPDAVFCYSDLVASGAIHTILRRGLGVPEDVAVIGYDNIEDGRCAQPTISTVAPDKGAIARIAVERLLLRISSTDSLPGLELRVSHRLIPRESSIGRLATHTASSSAESSR